jgi:hypothetical protein
MDILIIERMLLCGNFLKYQYIKYRKKELRLESLKIRYINY